VLLRCQLKATFQRHATSTERNGTFRNAPQCNATQEVARRWKLLRKRFAVLLNASLREKVRNVFLAFVKMLAEHALRYVSLENDLYI